MANDADDPVPISITDLLSRLPCLEELVDDKTLVEYVTSYTRILFVVLGIVIDEHAVKSDITSVYSYRIDVAEYLKELSTKI